MRFRSFGVTLCMLMVVSVMMVPGQFVPSEDWQVIPEGVAIPPGLHVRMNFETGLKEAKLWHRDASAGDVALVPAVEEQESKPRAELSADEWSQIVDFLLKKLTVSDPILNVKTALQNLTSGHSDQVSYALATLENLVDHIDYAKAFIDLNGIDVTFGFLEKGSGSQQHILSAINVLGIASQNNPKVAEPVFTHRSFGFLTRLLESHDASPELQLRILKSLSNILRTVQFDEQKTLGSLTPILARLFDHGSFQVKRAIASMVSSLLNPGEMNGQELLIVSSFGSSWCRRMYDSLDQVLAGDLILAENAADALLSFLQLRACFPRDRALFLESLRGVETQFRLNEGYEDAADRINQRMHSISFM